MATLNYNGVAFDFPHTRSVDAEVVYTPDGQDYLGTDLIFRVEGHVHGPDGESVGQQYLILRHALEQPRKVLIYTVDGFEVYLIDAKVDIHNGPFPRVISIDEVRGTGAFACSFEVRARIWGCPSGLPRFLSNRWKEVVNIGPDFLSRITRTGTLYLPEPLNVDSDAARGAVTPPLARNMNRVEAEYEIREDGLALSYRFVDHEVECNPPSPAIRIDRAEYSEYSHDGARRYGVCVCALTGIPRADRRALLATGILVCVRRLQQAGAMLGNAPSIVIYTMREELNRNKIYVSLQVLMPSILGTPPAGLANEIGKGFGIALGPGVLGRELIPGGAAAPPPAPAVVIPKLTELTGWGNFPAGSATSGAPDPGLRGTAGLMMIAAALSDPCLNQAIKQGIVGPNGKTPAGAPSGGTNKGQSTITPMPKIKIVPKIQQQQSSQQQASAPSLYTDAKVTVSFHEDRFVAHLAPTDSEGESATVALAGPTLQMGVTWDATRAGGPPSVPPRDIGANYTLLSAEKSNPEIVVAADGYTPLVRVSGSYLYAIKDMSEVVQGSPVAPWLLDQLRALQRSGQGSGASALNQMIAAAADDPSAEDMSLLPWLPPSTQASA